MDQLSGSTPSACCDFERNITPNRELLVSNAVEHATDHKARGAARVALASYLIAKADTADRLAFEDPTAKNDPNPKSWDAYVLECDVDATRVRAGELLQDVSQNYADESFQFRQFKTLGEMTAALLDQMNNIRVGKVAPEIDGLDLDGRRLKLSDHRGKVVMLVFWATWCSPCMAAVPDEQKIYDQFKGRQFVMLGVSADDDLEAARKIVAERGIPWSNWRELQSVNDRKESILDRYHVSGIPRVFLLDADGVIRSRGTGIAHVSQQIAALLEGLDPKPAQPD
jgi:peroxiredoxin